MTLDLSKQSKLIFGNWKMAQNLEGAMDFLKKWTFASQTEVSVVIFPSFPHLFPCRLSIQSRKLDIALGAQDCSPEKSGAFTGEVSADSLLESGCYYVLVGHSERRRRGPETAESLEKKLKMAWNAHLVPVYCIGETESEREAGQLKEVLLSQLALVKEPLGPCVVAYEPVWAIGTGKTASSADIQEAHAFIRENLSSKIPILYGGSVSTKNALEILEIPHVQGVLVGGASLKPADFQSIAEAALVAKSL